ncbi:MAG: M23 family metallopeptidase [Burkholderiaceae bacterium]|nr:M23 family metallopeptidase [Microbacteriaceae bacterium]
MPANHSRSVVPQRRGGIVVGRAAGSRAIAQRTTLTVMRGARRGLAMVVVTLAFVSSIAFVVPNFEASASLSAAPSHPDGGAQVMSQLSSAIAVTGVIKDGYGVTSQPKPPPPPPPPSVFAVARLVELVPSSSSASLQWPVPAGTKMSYGYGPRSCSGCSSFHEGADFNAPSGSPVWSIADGVVIKASEGGGPYGVFAVVQHLIDGEVVTTLYAHMLTGSLAVGVGSTVAAGQPLGAVGCTGSCTGTHLHFEVHPGGGASTDPVAWLNSKLG